MGKRKRSKSSDDDVSSDEETPKKSAKKARRQKDATRVARLSKRQLEYLNARVRRNIQRVWIGHGSKANKKDYCWRSDLPLTKQGYPRSLRLTKEMMTEDDDFQLDPRYSWNPAQIVMAADGRYATDGMMEASHLCYHPWCVNPAHIVWEMPIDNYARKNCVTWVTCPCPCGHGFNPCKHAPQCLVTKECTCADHSA